MTTHNPLTADGATRWRSRLPRAVLSLGGPALVVAGVGASVVVTETGPVGWSVAEVTSAGWAATSLAAGAAMGAALLLALRPHRATPWAAASAVVLAALDPSTRLIWLVVGGTLTVAAVVDHADAVRQRALAARSPAAVPDPPDVVSEDLRGIRLGRWLAAGVAALVLGLAAVAWFVRDARLADDFRADATVVRGEVVALEDDGMVALVRAEDGRDLRVPLPATWPEPGDAVEVLVAADGPRTELVGDPFDATGVLIPAGGLLLASALLLGGEVARRRRLAGLLDRGAPVTRALLVPARGRWLEVRDLDSYALVAAVAVDGAWWPDDDGVWRADDLDDVADDDEPDDGLTDDVGSLSDAELLDLARAVAADLDDPPADDESEPKPATIHGLDSYGEGPVLARTDDDMWLVVTDVRRAVPGRGLGDPRRGQHPRGASGDLPRLARATGSWLPWLVAPLLGGAAWFVVDGDAWRTLLLLPLAGAGYAWSAGSAPRVQVSPHGLRLALAVLDLPVPWRRVERVVHDEHAVVIRVVDPDDAHLLPEVTSLGPLVAGARDAPQAAALLDDARRAAQRVAPGEPRRWGWRRPTVPALVAGTWATAVLVGGLLVG